MESSRHQRLKVLAAAFLHAGGCAAVATEVRCPASRYRADVAGFADPLSRRYIARPDPPNGRGYSLRTPIRPSTAIIECKQSRADFLRDSRMLESLLSERRRLDADRRHLEERLIKSVEPHLLGSDTMLFPELEEWDFAASRAPGYRSLLRHMRRIDLAIHGDTKFWTIARYALADVLLIAAPAGLLRPAELPPGWGLLEFPVCWLEAPTEDGRYDELLSVRVRPASGAASLTRDVHRMRLLRNIAVAACGRRSSLTIRAVQVQGQL